MKKIQIRQYRRNDEKHLEPIEETMAWHPDYKKVWREVVRKEWTWTGLSSDGEILAVGGIIPQENNAAFMWANIGKKRKTDILRIIKRGMEVFDALNFDVWYCYVKDEFKRGCRMAEHLGFKKTKSIVKGYVLYENRRSSFYG